MFMNKTLAAVLATVICATPAVAQDTSNNQVAVKTAWSVFEETDPKECWGVTTPQETVNTKEGRVVSVNRDEILLMVFYRPNVSGKGMVTFTGGYTFASGSRVNVNIGGTDFTMFPDGAWAWPESAEDDAKIINAMKRGANAVVTALSSRGTTTKDTFSLLGFTAAFDEATKRCTG